MRSIMRVVIGLVGLLNVALGLGFLLAPAKMAQGFFLLPVGSQGLATLRADFTGFFLGAATFALFGAWRADPRPLLVPLVMLGLALAGRSFSLIVDGVGPDAIAPMVIELVMLVLLVAARRSFAAGAR
ncbi:MAG: hypothetical protein H7268_00955 [Sandarakinorhabdus sp.]|nr:hypothetical protein [Sandarakinorhabdus sp.]